MIMCSIIMCMNLFGRKCKYIWISVDIQWKQIKFHHYIPLQILYTTSIMPSVCGSLRSSF